MKHILKKIEFIEKYYLHYIIFFLSFILYLLTRHFIFALIGGLSILLIVGMDIAKGAIKKGAKHELKEIFIAIILALSIWFGLVFFLGTPIPLNAIVSCSMLPDYERGDLIILRGTNDIKAPEIYIENPEEITNTAIVSFNNESVETNGSLFVKCLNSNEEECIKFKTNPGNYYEMHGPLKFNYGICKRKYSDESIIQTICIKEIEYQNKTYLIDKNSDILVYTPKKEDLFALTGDIIHRVYLKIDSPKGKYYLIKGDNNPIFDIQMYSEIYQKGNSLVDEAQTKGVVITRIPYIGYAKLFLFGMWTEPQGCESYFIS
ncbi:MAG: hypothetical protein WC356_03080 [Candidatus Micrarchaeia archaeon]|jgi:energy-coupling factor transporter transmembrane protein EcfT